MNLEALIVGSERLVKVFHEWPRFHDAEVIEFRLRRGKKVEDFSVFIDAQILMFQEKPNSRKTIAKLQFDDVDEIQIKGFNYQNAILGLFIEARNGNAAGPDEPPSPIFSVRFEPAFGIGASFTCHRIEVLEAVILDSD